MEVKDFYILLLLLKSVECNILSKDCFSYAQNNFFYVSLFFKNVSFVVLAVEFKNNVTKIFTSFLIYLFC